jgi:hypothetical protein
VVLPIAPTTITARLAMSVHRNMSKELDLPRRAEGAARLRERKEEAR